MFVTCHIDFYTQKIKSYQKVDVRDFFLRKYKINKYFLCVMIIKVEILKMCLIFMRLRKSFSHTKHSKLTANYFPRLRRVFLKEGKLTANEHTISS